LLADAYRVSGQREDAANVFREEIAKRPDNVQAHMALGLVLREQKKSDEARREFEKAAELSPGNAMPLYQLVEMDIAVSDFDGAMQRVQRQLASDPKSAVSHFLQGRIYA